MKSLFAVVQQSGTEGKAAVPLVQQFRQPMTQRRLSQWPTLVPHMGGVEFKLGC
jgi:hypothetical protein